MDSYRCCCSLTRSNYLRLATQYPTYPSIPIPDSSNRSQSTSTTVRTFMFLLRSLVLGVFLIHWPFLWRVGGNCLAFDSRYLKYNSRDQEHIADPAASYHRYNTRDQEHIADPAASYHRSPSDSIYLPPHPPHFITTYSAATQQRQQLVKRAAAFIQESH